MGESDEIPSGVYHIRRNIEGMKNKDDILDMSSSSDDLDAQSESEKKSPVKKEKAPFDKDIFDDVSDYLKTNVHLLSGPDPLAEEEYINTFFQNIETIEQGLYDEERRRTALGLLSEIAVQPGHKVAKVALGKLVDHLNEIQEWNQDTDISVVSEAMRVVTLFAEEQDSDAALAIIHSWLDRDLANQTEIKFHQINSKISLQNIMFLIEQGSPQHVLDVYLKTLNILGNSEMRNSTKANIVTTFLEYPSTRVHMMGRAIEREILADFGLDPYKTIRDWQQGWPNKEQAEKMGKKLHGVDFFNLVKILDLEEGQPGICAVLQKEFNISSFYRYPTELLTRQYAERDNRNKAYGVVIYPKSDWNSAFYDSKIGLVELAEHVKEPAIRIVECESKMDVARSLIKLRDRYGTDNKIRFGIIGGHGSTDSIVFGGRDSRHVFTKFDLVGKGVGRITEFFDPDATLILVSCSTGVAGGVGEHLSKLLDLKVIAPDSPTNILSIDAIKQGDQLEFTVQYSGSSANQFAGRES